MSTPSPAPTLTPPPGYGPVVPLDKTRHAGLGLKPDRTFAWYRPFNAVYVGVNEFARAVLDYPVAFARDPNGGDPVPIAVLGLQEAQNLYIDAAGRWRPGAYVPAYVRRHPFCVAHVRSQDQPEPRPLICVQEDALAAGPAPLFDAKGAPTADWEPIRKLIEAIETSRNQTVSLCRRLDTLQLLTPFDALAVPRTGGGQLRLQGMLRVDEEKLVKLPGKDLRELGRSGALRAIYAHLISLENFSRLLDLSVAPAA